MKKVIFLGPCLPLDGRDPLEVKCPTEVIEAFRGRLASLDRGEGLTTEQLRRRRRAAREQ